MRSVKAVYENGHLMFPEGNGPEGRMEVVVVFPDQGEPCPPRSRDKDAGKRFVREVVGHPQRCDIEHWKERE